MEILAPAGNEKNFKAAINSGANAVYLGLENFSARKNAGNFTRENIGFFCDYAHLFGVKVYVAVNTLVKDGELADFFGTVAAAYAAGADAFIIQDVFLAEPLKRFFPDIVLHLSTQAGVNSVSGAQYAKEKGFSRVILSRETEIDEIKKIASIIETEVFVHGALCACFSGHCYMSSFIGGNSGNRGLCKQPCRKKYFTDNEKAKGRYALSLSDLNLSEKLTDLEKAGVKSVKIEGRMRAAEYVAAAVRLYVNASEGKKTDRAEIKKTYNRGDYTSGYTFGLDENIVSDKIQNHVGYKVGTVEVVSDGKLKVKTNESFSIGDAFKILRNGEEVANAACFESGKVLDFKGTPKKGDEVRVTKDVRLNAELLKNERNFPLKVKAEIAVGKAIKLFAAGVTVYGDAALEEARNVPTKEEEIRENLLKTDVYPFAVETEVVISGKPFVPKSAMNKARASLYSSVFSKDRKERKINDISLENENFYKKTEYGGIVVTDKPVSVYPENAAVVFAPEIYNAETMEKLVSGCSADKYLFVPSFLPEKDEKVVSELLGYFDGVYADGFSGIMLAKKAAKKVIYGIGLNIFNSRDVISAYKDGADIVVASQELSEREISSIKYPVFTFLKGSIRVMELLFCPFGHNCAACKRGNDGAIKDETGHEFRIRRYRLSGRCRFEVYNGSILFEKEKQGFLYNFIGIADPEKLLFGDKSEIGKIYGITGGDYRRGIN